MAEQDQDRKLIEEEQDYLDAVISAMDKELLRLNSKWTQKDLDAKKQRDSCLPDTYGALIDDEDDKYWIKNERRYLEQVRDELYGNRLVLEVTDKFDEDEEEPQEIELKVGLHTYVNGTDIFVCSWKRPVCRQFLLNEDAREFTGVVEDENGRYETLYTLRQKREVKLDFDRVIKAVQLYSDEIEDSEGIVSDEFLQELLSRRTEREFKNIIFSIQKKQGEIIQKPFDQDIIVQGCAGSGKSMIMLHRLPILLYDNPNSLSMTNIYIITPSRSYIQQAQNMLYQLEIASLPMGTLEDYYIYAITKYGRALKECGTSYSYKKMTLEQEQYIYSKECVNDIAVLMNTAIEEKHVEFETGISQLSLENDADVKKRLGEFTGKTFAERIQDHLIIYQKISGANVNSLRQYYINIRAAINAVKDLRSALLEHKSAVLRAMDRQITQISEDIQKVNQEIARLNRIFQRRAVATRREQLQKLTESLEEIQEIRRKASQDKEYFPKLEGLMSELNDVLKIYSDFKNDYGEYKTQKELYELISHIDEFSNKILSVTEKIENLEDPYSNYSNELMPVLLAAKSSIISLLELKEPVLEKEYISKISHGISEYRDLQKTLIMDVYKEILTKVGEDPDKRGNYKLFSYSAYLFLQILYQYQGAPNSQVETLITIDEAQNLAVEELALIKKVNHNQVILNLFGDIKQHFENSKGVDDWSEVSQVAPFQISEMNENYRNARQITQYCNNRFNMNMEAINWDGEGYKEFLDLEQYPEEINKILVHPHLEGICAIIVADRSEAKYICRVFEKFSSKINDMTVDNPPINEAKWNLMTISQAKGLEFRTVLAISGRMTQNQKYVAYTRALDRLYIFDEIIELSEEDMASDEDKKKKSSGKSTSKVKESEKKEENKSISKEIKKEKNAKEKSTGSSDNKQQDYGSDVKEFFEKAGLKVVDERSKGGYLWVIGDEDKIKDYVNEAVDKFEISGRFAKGKRTGWFTNTPK